MSMRLSRIASAAVLAFASLGASALELRLNDFSIPGPSGVNVSVMGSTKASWNGAAGQFSGLLDGESFASYCVDLLQPIDFGVTYSGYTRVAAAAVFGANKAEDLSRLLTYVGPSPKYSTDSAMVQAAVWEVVYERGAKYSFVSGNATAAGQDGATQDWLNALDWTAVRNTAPLVDVSVLVHPRQQDLLVVTPIPEPSTYAMMVGGLAVVAFVARRRSRQG